MTEAYHVSTNQRVATQVAPSWRDPKTDSPPRGVKIQIYVRGGTCIYGTWIDTRNYLAWAPLLKTPQWLREAELAAYSRSIRADNLKLERYSNHEV